jgi:SH3-like domain-containing protein
VLFHYKQSRRPFVSLATTHRIEARETLQMTASFSSNFKRIPPERRIRLFLVLLAYAVAVSAAAFAPVGAETGETSTPVGSGLPVPRFVSLKSDRVNLRNGPGTEYPTGWVYRRAGLPLEIVKEFEGWRQVRDAEGVTGWVLQSFLSGRRTGLVLPWERKAGKPPPVVPIRSSDSERSHVVANVEAGVIADLHTCDGRWCRVTVDDYSGYIEQKKLWGVYEGETIK